MTGTPVTSTVLVVEDSGPLCKMIVSMLRANGFRVLEAADGAEALEILSRDTGNIELVLTDIVMPRVDGSELARSVYRMRPGLPVLFMSGFTDEPVVQDVVNGGAHFLRKPFTAPVLINAVQTALACHSRKTGSAQINGSASRD